MRRSVRVPATAAMIVVAAALLAGCAGPSTPTPDASSGAQIESTAPSGAESPADTEAGSSGLPLPADWPAAVFVPDGEIVIATERGGGWDLLIEGVDEAEIRAGLQGMASAGFDVTGPTDMGSGEWTAEAADASHAATYAYASGGAGLPNVRILLMPAT